MSTKEGVASSLFHRAKDIVSEQSNLEKENKWLIKLLTSSDYDKRTIMKVKDKIEKAWIANPPNNDETTEEYVGNVSLPYIPGTSEALQRILKSYKIRCFFHSKNTLRKLLSRPKDTIDE